MAKQPRSAYAPQIGKVPRGGQQAQAIQSKNFCWRFSDIDWDGPWGWSKATGEQLVRTIVPKLHDYESMTWAAIEGPTGSHFVEFKDLCKEARDRLLKIGKDEQGQLFSVRLSGELRVWGVRDVAILRVLWW